MKYCFIILIVFSISTSQDIGYIDSTKVRNPKLAWKLAFIPGMGQLYNGKYVKALGFIGAEYFSVKRFIELKEEDNIAIRNTYGWWVFGFFVWNMLDAYVDAQLSTFPVKRLEFNNEVDSLRVPLE